ncbi:MAG TPA: ParB/RepB/Spo0J family partition protein [Fimbriimonadaceae bacterium]|jgi:ParB family chromosome partitioning protein
MSPAQILEVPLSAITPNRRQPRTYFKQEAVEELAASIREVGILQPLVVRPLGPNRYELIAGERRFRASKLAGLKQVPVVVRTANDQASLELAIIENVQREDISPLESAKAYRRLMDEFGLTQEAVAAKVGKSRVAVANTVRLVKLPPRVLEGLEKGDITEAHARTLLGLANSAMQLAVFDQILERALTVKQVEKLASGAMIKAVKGAKPKDSNLQALFEEISIRLGAPTKVEANGKGGKIVIDYFSDDDLIRIVELLLGS